MKARVLKIIQDVCNGNPDEMYHPDIAKFYDTDVPENAENGDTLIDGVLTKPDVAAIEPTIVKTVSPIVFKLRFTAPERVAIYQSTDLIVKDFVALLDDVRLTLVDLTLQSTIDAIDYLIAQNLIATSRKDEILA
ncbi:MAG: hypothetical protein WBI40_07555 [Methylococcaceae bacterium]